MAGIKMCSKIFVLDHGVLVEEGGHDHLISLGGKYSEMYNAQIDSIKKEMTNEQSVSTFK